jgi:uncharacterized protein YkwD
MKPVLFLTHFSLVLVAAICLVPAAVAQPADGDATTVAEQYLLSAANQERTALGLPTLHRDAQLARAAGQHAREMAAHSAISHQFPGEAGLTARAAGTGVRFSVVSENVGEAPSAVKIHDMWMHSTGHRTNLLDPAVDAAGISVIARGGELYAVEDFAKTVRSASLEEQESSVAALLTQRGVMAIDVSPETVSAARKTCTMSTGYAGTRTPQFVMRFTSDSLAVLPEQLRARLAAGKSHQAAVGACADPAKGPFTSYNIAVLLYP